MALPYAEYLARNSRAALSLVHVEANSDTSMQPEASTEYGVRNVDMAEYLESVSTQLRQVGIQAFTMVERGMPGQGIAEAAQKQNAELIIMSSHGRTGPGRGALGGVTDRVIHACHVPVLVVPARAV
jgi:nucleotide-binding universal stress UspA family protein